jgi:uncharacterized iron-regulated membrane protein
MAKWIIGIIVVALIAAGLYYSGVFGKLSMAPAAPATQTATTTQQTPQQPQPENGMAATNDASDAAITQDAAAVDAQMQGLSSDSANVDSSLNDKSVQ